jgi:uncharacterized damage-inducible protein DinB
MSLKTRVARLEAKAPTLREWIASLSDEELDREIERSRAKLRDHVAGMTEEEFLAYITEEPSDPWGAEPDEALDKKVLENQIQWYRRVRREVTASEPDPDERR